MTKSDAKLAAIKRDLMADVRKFQALEKRLRKMGQEHPANSLSTAIIYVRTAALSIRPIEKPATPAEDTSS